MSDSEGWLAREHAAVWASIPWCVNGTANEQELERARRHLESCADCRDEWALNERMRLALRPSEGAARHHPPAQDPQPGLQRLLARIDAVPVEQASDTRAAPSRWLRVLAVAAVVQAVGLSVLLAAWWSRDGDGRYETLSSSAPSMLPAPASPAAMPDAVVEVVLAPQTTLAELRDIAQRAGLQVLRLDDRAVQLAPVPGPGSTTEAAVERLHADSRVLEVRAPRGPR